MTPSSADRAAATAITGPCGCPTGKDYDFPDPGCAWCRYAELVAEALAAEREKAAKIAECGCHETLGGAVCSSVECARCASQRDIAAEIRAGGGA